MRARAGHAVVAVSMRVVAPRVDSGPFFARHAVTPPSMLHAFAFCGRIETLLLETDVAQTFHGRHIRDVCSRSVGRSWSG